ncbi:MAG: sulfite exporter TauE/SafE family protein [Candidatus Thiodiazotropha sp. (ex Dulcina madagascariensis)]|nr:sulfite exporter TauE/SafE family protein [Candidatus Thiodiazotropha sp. (ex Dulcina madagascariensis)]MCU7926387.1 sulfite exporter TauE/SafE family protein [Candidatus Thiodiazotropha sp. (ex Dulcina madagascariensis)]
MIDAAHVVLPVAAFITSALTGVVGMGGGLMLLLVMAEFLSFTALIPVHGVNQFITHFSRAAVSFRNINYRISLQFAIGAAIGAIAGSNYVLQISEELFKILLGLFVLFSLFLPKFRTIKPIPGKWSIIGAITSFCGLFVGATGILIAPFFVNEGLDKEKLVATKAACQVFIHGSKVTAFFFLGFVLGPYLLLIIMMGIMSFLGSLTAKHLLSKIHERHFLLLFKIVIIALALRLTGIGLYRWQWTG